MLVTDPSLVSSEQPTFEEGDHAVNPRHQFRWSLLLPLQEGDLVLVTFALQRIVAQPAIGMNEATRFHCVPHKRHQACGRSIHNLAHANPADAWPVFLSSNNHQRFLQVEATGPALLQTAHITDRKSTRLNSSHLGIS